MPLRRAHNGFTLPAIGFGTGGLNGFAGVEGIKSALSVGYRLLDTAFNYENEGTVGRAIRESEVPREEIIVTSKLPGRHHAYDEARICIEESVNRMGLDYIDLYLIHWPNPSQGQYVEAWRALVDAQRQGIVKQIGVSNFLPGHIDMLERVTGVTPVVNQIERHPYYQQAEQMAYDQEHGIITEAWCPLGRANRMLEDKDIVAIARKHAVTPGEVILRWHMLTGDVAIPKSASLERQRTNLAVSRIKLDELDMARLKALDNPLGSMFGFDPRFHEED
ncbi:aldo/keto reductase [Bifidobacterium sp. ESL0775]|uniref:aldo/keto reductase n=1 Tax=Bifidobacterium sp. ESL0775 TaxID=2983230 RepID=UPI0032AF28CD